MSNNRTTFSLFSFLLCSFSIIFLWCSSLRSFFFYALAKIKRIKMLRLISPDTLIAFLRYYNKVKLPMFAFKYSIQATFRSRVERKIPKWRCCKTVDKALESQSRFVCGVCVFFFCRWYCCFHCSQFAIASPHGKNLTDKADTTADEFKISSHKKSFSQFKLMEID